MSKPNATERKWVAAEIASIRAQRILIGAGVHVKSYQMSAAGASVECQDAEQAARVVVLIGGKIDKGGNGYPVNTVRCPK